MFPLIILLFGIFYLGTSFYKHIKHVDNLEAVNKSLTIENDRLKIDLEDKIQKIESMESISKGVEKIIQKDCEDRIEIINKKSTTIDKIKATKKTLANDKKENEKTTNEADTEA